MNKRKDGNNGRDGGRDVRKDVAGAAKDLRKVPATPAAAAGAAKPGAGATGKVAVTASGLDLEAVRELARIAGEFGLTEIEAEPSGRIRVSRRAVATGAEAAAVAPGPTAPPIALALAPAPAAPSVVEGAAAPGTFITSPFVGTFYSAPSPDAAPFVAVGDEVKKGQVVCIVEAMKLMNEIEAEANGKVAEVMVQNGEHVEYGQALIRLITR
jgi:acetyl-CoA carboxylase biotin carboxyl carrier protein